MDRRETIKPVFISYVRENKRRVSRLCQDLGTHGIQIWLDRIAIAPGTYWKDAIRNAIRSGSFFIACFSSQYNRKKKTYMNTELSLAVEEFTSFSDDRSWFIPVLLDRCTLPTIPIGGTRTLMDIQFVSLYENWNQGITSIVSVITGNTSDEILHVSEKTIHAKSIKVGKCPRNEAFQTIPHDQTITHEFAGYLRKQLAASKDKTIKVLAYDASDHNPRVGEKGLMEVEFRQYVEFVRGRGYWDDHWLKNYFRWELCLAQDGSIVAQSRFSVSPK